MEDKIKYNLLLRGFSKKTITNNRGLIGATIDETILEIVKNQVKPIDKVTVEILDVALRMVGIQLHLTIIDKIIDLVELIEVKGEEVSIKDVCALQEVWKESDQ